MVTLGGLKGAAMSVGLGVAGALGGVAASNFITTNITPKIFAPQATDTPQSVAWKNLAVNGAFALGVALYGKKVVPPLLAYSVAIGIVLLPARQVVYAMAPAGKPFTFLGGGVVAMPPFSRGNRPLNAYPGTRAALPMGSYPRATGRGMGAYPAVAAYPQDYGHHPG